MFKVDSADMCAGVNGGLIGGSSVRRPGSEDPNRRQQNLFNNFYSVLFFSFSSNLSLMSKYLELIGFTMKGSMAATDTSPAMVYRVEL